MEKPLLAAPLASEADLGCLRSELARAVARVCPSWLADRSEDVVQVALMRVLEVHKRSEGKASFSSFYLRKAAYSAVVDEIRRLRRRQEVQLEDAGIESWRSGAAADPERTAAGREAARAIRDCLSRLRRSRRLAVTLHLLGHSVPEAARLLGWSVKQTENQVYRGLANLRACLASAGVVG